MIAAAYWLRIGAAMKLSRKTARASVAAGRGVGQGGWGQKGAPPEGNEGQTGCAPRCTSRSNGAKIPRQSAAREVPWKQGDAAAGSLIAGCARRRVGLLATDSAPSQTSPPTPRARPDPAVTCRLPPPAAAVLQQHAAPAVRQKSPPRARDRRYPERTWHAPLRKSAPESRTQIPPVGPKLPHQTARAGCESGSESE